MQWYNFITVIPKIFLLFLVCGIEPSLFGINKSENTLSKFTHVIIINSYDGSTLIGIQILLT